MPKLKCTTTTIVPLFQTNILYYILIPVNNMGITFGGYWFEDNRDDINNWKSKEFSITIFFVEFMCIVLSFSYFELLLQIMRRLYHLVKTRGECRRYVLLLLALYCYSSYFYFSDIYIF